MDADGLSLIMSVPELLKKGVEIYESLKSDMSQALGLRQYAEHLSHITQILKEANKFLDEKEQALAKKLDEAYCLSQRGMDKAIVVVSVIKAQSETLVMVLSESGHGTNHEKLWAACKYFSAFAKEIEHNVTEAEDALREASNTLFSARNEIGSIVNTLKGVQDKFLAELDEAQAKQRGASYGGAPVGLINGPLGVIISSTIATAFTEFHTIPKIKIDFQKQREKFSEYIIEFESMQSETMALKTQLDGKRMQLIEVHSKLIAARGLAGIDDSVIRSIPLLHLDLIRKVLQALVKSCDEFLDTTKNPVEPSAKVSVQ